MRVVEAEGLEKGLAARAAGAEYVVVCGGSTLGRAPLPPDVQESVIARDADARGSPADCALWRGVVHRLGHGIKTLVTSRPNEIAPKDAPPLKDLDDVWRYDPELARVLLKGTNLAHGRLGEDVDRAILDAASRLDAVELGRARRSVAAILCISLAALDGALAALVKKRIEALGKLGLLDDAKVDPGPEPWEHPVTDIGAVLDEMLMISKRHVNAPDTHFDTKALWDAHTHIVHREDLGVDVSPRLGIQSVEKDSGKTTFMKLSRETVARPLSSGSVSTSSLFRAVDKRKCTFLVAAIAS
jgi:hypothetical protein